MQQYSGEYVSESNSDFVRPFTVFSNTITDDMAILCNACVPAVWTCGLFLLQTGISQQVDKTARTHQMSIGALWLKRASIKQGA